MLWGQCLNTHGAETGAPATVASVEGDGPGAFEFDILPGTFLVSATIDSPSCRLEMYTTLGSWDATALWLESGALTGEIEVVPNIETGFKSHDQGNRMFVGISETWISAGYGCGEWEIRFEERS